MVGVYRTAPGSSRDSIYLHHGRKRTRRTYNSICLWCSDYNICGRRLLFQSFISPKTHSITRHGRQPATTSQFHLDSTAFSGCLHKNVRHKPMHHLIRFLIAMFLMGCAHADLNGIPYGEANASKEAAIAQATKDLKRIGIDPNKKKLTVSKVLTADTYFKTSPKNEYWNQGRQAVGSALFYIVTFSEPKISPGGTHQYFYHSDSHQLLWVARSK